MYAWAYMQGLHMHRYYVIAVSIQCCMPAFIWGGLGSAYHYVRMSFDHFRLQKNSVTARCVCGVPISDGQPDCNIICMCADVSFIALDSPSTDDNP